jgi:hypothetical protein
MGFKMNGSPAKMGTIQGTAGHSSALKMKVEENASALKQMTITKEDMKGSGFDAQEGLTVSPTGSTYTTKHNKDKKLGSKKLDPSKKADKAVLEARWKKGNKASGGTLNDLVKQRKGVTKGTPEYNKIQNQINAALGSKKKYDEGPVAGEQTTTGTNGGNETTGTNGGNETNNNNKITPTNDAQVFSSLSNTSTIKKGISNEDMLKIEGKSKKRQGEYNENLNKAEQKNERKTAKALYGKDSSEYQKQRIQELDAKRADRMGTKGGKRQMWGLRQINNLGGNIRTKNALKKGLKARAKEEAAAGAANNSAAKYHSPAKQNIFAEGNNPKKTIEEEASDYRKNTKNRDKTKVDPITQKYVDYVNTKVGVGGGPKRDKYGNLIK